MTTLDPYHNEVLNEITAERERQSQLRLHDNHNHLGAWHTIISAHTGKLAEISLNVGLYESVASIQDEDKVAAIHTASIELAAVAVALSEQTSARLANRLDTPKHPDNAKTTLETVPQTYPIAVTLVLLVLWLGSVIYTVTSSLPRLFDDPYSFFTSIVFCVFGLALAKPAILNLMWALRIFFIFPIKWTRKYFNWSEPALDITISRLLRR